MSAFEVYMSAFVYGGMLGCTYNARVSIPSTKASVFRPEALTY
jgi:hypothetical protein